MDMHVKVDPMPCRPLDLQRSNVLLGVWSGGSFGVEAVRFFRRAVQEECLQHVKKITNS